MQMFHMLTDFNMQFQNVAFVNATYHPATWESLPVLESF